MPTRSLSRRHLADRAGIVLSGLCAVHCLASIVVVSVLGIGGGWLLAPEIHHWGLALAIAIAALTIGAGALRHRRRAPLAIAGTGLAFMAGALLAEHGVHEAVLTIAGVILVSIGHLLNLRHRHRSL